MFWERQFESMLDNGHMDAETLADLGIAYAEEIGDLSLVDCSFAQVVFAGVLVLNRVLMQSSFSDAGSPHPAYFHSLAMSVYIGARHSGSSSSRHGSCLGSESSSKDTPSAWSWSSSDSGEF